MTKLLAADLGHEPLAQATLHFVVLGLLIPAWYCFGKLAQRAKLPQISGYVIGGIICGHSGLNLLRNEAQQTLLAIDHACLAIIALTAGAELQFDNIRRVFKQVTALTLWISLCSWAFVFMALAAMLPYIPFLVGQSRQQSGIISLGAMLMVARSPASAIAVVKETGGKGPYCSLILAVVVMKDVLVFICFALNLEYVRMVELSAQGGQMRLTHILHPFVSLACSSLLGFAAGYGLSNFVSWRPAVWWERLAPVARRLPAPVVSSLRSGCVAGTAVLLFWLADWLDAEPLLACVMAGLVSANRRVADQGKGHEGASDSLSRLMVIVNATFFGLAGTSIRLGALFATIWVAIMIWAARLAGILSGSWLGAWLGGAPLDHQRKIWQGMVTQAGVAMGLAKTVATRFPTWGPEFATLMFAVILLNLCVGPPLFRHAIHTTGEASVRSGLGILDVPVPSPKPRPENGSADKLENEGLSYPSQKSFE